MADFDQIREQLSDLVTRGSKYLRRYAFKEAVENAMTRVHLIALVVPVLFVLSTGIEFLVSQSFWPLGIVATICLSVLVPVAYVAASGFTGFLTRNIDRRIALALFDRELGFKDRLQSADEFLQSPSPTEFESAAINDAAPYARQAIDTELGRIKVALPKLHVSRWQYGVASVVLLGIGVFFATYGTSTSQVFADVDQLASVPTDDNNPSDAIEEFGDGIDELSFAEQSLEQKLSQSDVLDSDAASSLSLALDKADPANSNSRQSMQMGMTGSASNENQAGSASSNLSGQGNPKKRKNETKASAEKSKKKQSNSPQPEQNRKEDSASGIAGGKGSGSGRTSSPTEMLENENKVLQADADPDVDLESDDEEDEEQKAASAARPLLNQRKAPVDRQLTPSGMAGNDENELANGRSGAGGLKKTRGVAAMLLGVPMPDKLASQVNPGRIKVQRERAVPHPNELELVQSEYRGNMDDSIGRVAHRELKPWMRDVVRNYFNALRQPIQEQGE